MKSIVLGILKFSLTVFLAVFLSGSVFGQAKYEREFRIKKSQFPSSSLQVASPYLDGVRRLRFYKEIDSSKQSYEIKFKRDKLHYSVEFSDRDELEDIEVRIKPVDIPNDSYAAIEAYLTKAFSKYKIRKIQQQYPRMAFSSNEETFRNAFQNLILPEIRYELIVNAKTSEGYRDYEVLFDSQGKFRSQRVSLPANYDHVLY